MKQIDIKEKYGYDVYNKYKNMVKEIVGKYFKDRCNSNITFFELENQAWIAIMLGHDNYKEEKETKIETHIYNNIVFGLNTYLRANLFTIKVSHVEHTNRIAGYNKMYYRKIQESYNKKEELGIISKEEKERFLEDTKKELKTQKLYEQKECMFSNKKDEENDEYNDSFENIIIKNDIYTTLEQKDLIINILIECFNKRIINKEELNIIREYYINDKITLNYKSVIKKISNFVNKSKYKEDLEEIIKEFN